MNRNNDLYLMQLDKQTNRILRIPQSKLLIPDTIQDIQLSLDQKIALREGRAIELTKGDRKLSVQLDLNQRSGFSIKQTELTLEKKRSNQIGF